MKLIKTLLRFSIYVLFCFNFKRIKSEFVRSWTLHCPTSRSGGQGQVNKLRQGSASFDIPVQPNSAEVEKAPLESLKIK